MQAEEMERRLQEAGFQLGRRPGAWTRGTINVAITKPNQAGSQVCAMFCPFEDMAALLLTDEERLALLALRAGYWAEWNQPDQSFWVLSPTFRAAKRLNAASAQRDVKADTTMAALAAAGRVLEEGEQRG